jgi:lipoate-protein ligase A
MRQWRLIYDKPLTGAVNMATDEAILQAVAAGDQPPTLRVYAWQPLCLSLGYGQRVRDVDTQQLQQIGYNLVRRPTGGKAILHGDELTYSVALPRDHDLAEGDVIASYRRISEALITALRLLGLSPASEKEPKGTKGTGPVCFEVPSHYEITVEGKKLIGSAQVRRKIGILQHGTLPLHGDIARICDVLAYDSDTARTLARRQVRQRATTLQEVTGRRITWQEAAAALVEGFAQTFDIDFTEGTLSPAEQDNIRHLVDEQYGHPDWTNKR